MNDSIKREQSEFACSADRENLRPKGKKIINPWRNRKGYNCFGCSPDNPIGLHLEFYEDGDYIVSTWHPGHRSTLSLRSAKNYQGWVDTMHGGILSTLIDEVCGWVVTRKLQTSGYTVQLSVKFFDERSGKADYRKAVPTTEPELTIRAKSDKTGEKPCLYQCGDHQFEG